MKNVWRMTGSLTLLAAITACNNPPTQFATSPMGKEVRQMISHCMTMQNAGLLPGFAAEEGTPLLFDSEAFDFALRQAVHYPLQLNCIVDNGKMKKSIALRKHSINHEWALENKI